MNDTEEQSKGYVEHIQLGVDLDKRVALASVRIGEVLIHGAAIWRSRHGKLRVYFPSYKVSYGYSEAIELSADLRSEVEADVISRYKSEKQKAKKAESKGERER